MSTKKPKPELSAHFLRELRVLEGKDYVQYKARTKELALPDDYKVYHYEPAAGSQTAAYWVGKCTVDKCPICGTPYPSKAAAELAESKLTHYIMVEREGGRPEISPVTLYLRRIRWRCYECYKERGTYNASMQRIRIRASTAHFIFQNRLKMERLIHTHGWTSPMEQEEA